jgi:hypothetical protein
MSANTLSKYMSDSRRVEGLEQPSLPCILLAWDAIALYTIVQADSLPKQPLQNQEGKHVSEGASSYVCRSEDWLGFASFCRF